MIKTIAVLLTCHNRKEKTVACITHLFESKRSSRLQFDMDVFVTDDGSTDGTSTELKMLFPTVNIIYGSGNEFWAGGMRIAWKAAMNRNNYDGFLLLNDDTRMDIHCFEEIFKAHEYSLKHYGKGSIYIGSVRDPVTKEFTYGGRILVNRWTFATQNVLPDGNFKECHLGNANIMFVYRTVVEAIGIFSEKYIHAKADHDYTLRAYEKKFPILVCQNYCGYCTYDKPIHNFSGKSLKERIRYLKSPKGVEMAGYMYFMQRFFPFRAPFVFCSLWLQTLMPGLTRAINKLMLR